jgi:hypothetical protein
MLFTKRQRWLMDRVAANRIRVHSSDDDSWNIIQNRNSSQSQRQPSQREARSLIAGRFVHLVTRPDLGTNTVNGVTTPHRLVQLTSHGRWAIAEDDKQMAKP